MLTITSTTDAVTARDSAHSTPRRARHAGRWRGAKTKSIARLIVFKKMGFSLLKKCGAYDYLSKEAAAWLFTVR